MYGNTLPLAKPFCYNQEKGDGAMIVTSLPLTQRLIILL